MATSVSMSSPVATPGPLAAPTSRRRPAAMLYEGLLLFGVMFGATVVLLLLHLVVPPFVRAGNVGLQVQGFPSLGLYFVWFQRKCGQTLAVQIWRTCIVSANGSHISLDHTIARYLPAWVWVATAVGVIHLSGTPQWTGAGVALACLLVWDTLAWFDPQRQFLHDRLVGTRLVRD